MLTIFCGGKYTHMGKYYIANGSGFISPDWKISQNVNNAKRFARDDARESINKYLEHPEEFSLLRKFTTGKKYVVIAASKFVGADGKISTSPENTKVFRSAADAVNYARSHREVVKYMDSPVILDGNYERVDVPVIKKFTDEQLKILGVEKVETPTPRVHIAKKIRAEVCEANICSICGKPMTEWDKTLDHIVPLSRGGKNDPSNYRCVHKQCNKLKDNMLDKELVAQTTDVEAKYIYDNPGSDNAICILRAFLRGMLNEYSKQGLLPG